MEKAMSKLQVFDPAMCCSTGVCGPSVDPALPRFAADLEWLKSKGLQVERYNLAQEVAAFTSNPVVKTALNTRGSKCLPLLLLDGTIVAEGAYPTRMELASLAHVEFEPGPIVTQVKELQPFVTIGGAGKSGTR
jgi:arsenical resistance operon trans-acting repressor ArsD